MRALYLVRTTYTDIGTFGVLHDFDKTPICLILERPWKNNQRGISCIPCGTYICKRINSPKFGETFQVTNVKGRTAILFHVGNLQTDTHGCLVTGDSFNPLYGQSAVLGSRKAFNKFMNILNPDDYFNLEISRHGI